MSTGRFVMTHIVFAVCWRARADMRSMVEGSTHCRSSITNSSGASKLSVSSASRISRSMRSRVAPRISCCLGGHFKTGQRTITLDELVLPYRLAVWQVQF